MRLTGNSFARATAPAGAETGLLSRLRKREESNLLSAWFSGGAGGIAVDTGGTHGIHKRAIGSSVSAENSLPALFFVHRSISLHITEAAQLPGYQQTCIYLWYYDKT
jgi:hypothetical protein